MNLPAVEAEAPSVTQQAKAKPAAKAPGKRQQKQLGNYFPSAVPAGGGKSIDYTLEVVVAPSVKPKEEVEEDDDTDVN